ncbi:MAG: hypothetical protein FWB93_01665 [Oscillospiraceae bacterium]|nr:hypothetical protein [Oscillospiraceae bacterium]
MKKHLKLILMLTLAVLLMLTLLVGFVGCGSDGCNSENCDRHPATGSCHCHGNCEYDGCNCHTHH